MAEDTTSTIFNKEPRLVKSKLRDALKTALSEPIPLVIRKNQLAKLVADAKGFTREELGIDQISVTKEDGEDNSRYIARTADALDKTELNINPINVTGTNDGDDNILKVLSGIENLDAPTSSEILRSLFCLLGGTELVRNTVMVIVLPDKEKKKEVKKKKLPRRRQMVEEVGSHEGDMESAA